MTEYVPSFWRTVALKSALARYLAFHLRIRESWTILRTTAMGLFGGSPQRQDPKYAGSTLAAVSEEWRTLSISVVDAFLHDLPKHSGLPPKRILLLVDGLRSSIYAPETAARDQSSFFASMRRYLMAKAAVRGYPVIDLHEVFEADYRRNGKRFEFDIDAHWSAYGHGVIARAVMRTPWYAWVLGGE